MNLSKTTKEQIVRKIMLDVPEVDYGQLIHDVVQAEALRMMPPEVRAIYDNVEMRGYLSGMHLAVHGYGSPSVPPIFWRRCHNDATDYVTTIYLTKKHWNSSLDPLTKTLVDNVYWNVQDLMSLAETQAKARESMCEKLFTMLAGIRTLKQAKTLLEPELHKYLPVEPPKDPAQKALQASTAVVPYVVANLREMGWPKDQEPKADADAAEVV